jgi:hypothetical protein
VQQDGKVSRYTNLWHFLFVVKISELKPESRLLPEQAIFTQVIDKSPAFMKPGVHNWARRNKRQNVPQTRWIQSKISCHMALRSVSMASFRFHFSFLVPVFWSSYRNFHVCCLCGLMVSSWLKIQTSRFDSPRCQIFWEVVGLERGPLSFVSTIEELLERKSSGSGLENQEYCPRSTLYPQKVALTSPTRGCRSVGIVRSRTHATEVASLLCTIYPSNLFCWH